MKKYLFSAVSVFALFAYQAKAQQATLTVKPDTNVKVMEGALLFVNGNANVEAYTAPGKSVSNSGRIKITEKLTNENGTGSNFVNEYNSTGSYGQLIVDSGADKSKVNTGKISSGVKFNPASNFPPFAVPYTGINAGDLVKEIFNNSSVSAAFLGYTPTGNNGYDPNRFKNPLFYWNNDTYTLDNLNEGDELKNPERLYAASRFVTSMNIASAVTKLSGVPFKDDLSVDVKGYVPGPNNTSPNKYGEAYGSYIEDFTNSAPGSWTSFKTEADTQPNTAGYGANIYYFGNPYTSNIDLSKGEGFFDSGKVVAIYQDTQSNYKDDTTTAAATYNLTKATTANNTGDKLQYVRPFQAFGVKLNIAQGASHTFKFKNDMKTFDLPDNVSTSVVNSMFLKGNKAMPTVNQVGLDLYDANNTFTGVKTYVVASDIYEASQKGEGIEIYMPSMSDKDMGIYTLQENEEGGVDAALADNKSYINGVNADKYIAKPIRLVVQNGKGKYTLKARLNETLENSKNAFYFEDKETGKVQKVGKDFAYTFNVNGTEKDRFVLYWAATPKTKSVDEFVKEETSATVVFKDMNTYKVRFDKSIKRADIFVYNISGQLINVAKGVDTSVDYIVPLRGNTTVYIVKVVGDNGKVVTKKIIK